MVNSFNIFNKTINYTPKFTLIFFCNIDRKIDKNNLDIVKTLLMLYVSKPN